MKTRATISILVGLIFLTSFSVVTLAEDMIWKRYNAAGISEYQKGHYANAEKYLKKAIKRAKTFEPNDPRLSISLNYLGLVHHVRAEYEQAEQAYKQALAIRVAALGEIHPDVAQSMNNLAEVYRAQRRYKEAVPLYNQAIEIWEESLGPDHHEIAAVLNNVAELFRSRSLYNKAWRLYKRALAIDEKALGADHPYVATDLNNLALTYHALGRYREAGPLHERALAIRKKALGPTHPQVGLSLENLGWLRLELRDYEEADQLFRHALAIYEKAFGTSHPRVHSTRDGLAAVHRALAIAREQNVRQASHRMDHRNVIIMSKKPSGRVEPDVKVLSGDLALNNIRRAIELLFQRSGIFRNKINVLMSKGRVVIFYDPDFPEIYADSTGTILAAYHPDLVISYGNSEFSKSFTVIMGRYIVKWPIKHIASAITHELVGHGIQDLEGRLKGMSEASAECEARLYQEIVHQDLQMDKHSFEMVGFRQALEQRWCIGLKQYIAINKPPQMALWQTLNLDGPRLLALFAEYLPTIRRQ
jgi:tetratricopeptide (TPR) repeat protein